MKATSTSHWTSVRTKHDVLFLPTLNMALKPNPTQHGSRPLHPTTTALLPLTTAIATGFNQQKPSTRTATLAIDFSKAFDSVRHLTLLQKISNSNLHCNYVRWLTTYLRGRTAACLYQYAVSPNRIIRSRVPQGSVISATLFNWFLHDCPFSAGIITSFADDLTLAVTHPDCSLDVSTLSARLQSD